MAEAMQQSSTRNNRQFLQNRPQCRLSNIAPAGLPGRSVRLSSSESERDAVLCGEHIDMADSSTRAGKIDVQLTNIFLAKRGSNITALGELPVYSPSQAARGGLAFGLDSGGYTMNLKTMLAASAMTFLAVGGARAADAVVEEPPVPVAEIPVFTWTGGYAGLQGGYAWTNLSVDGGAFAIDDLNGGLFGGYVGYNWQSDAWVFGAEADINGLWNDQNFAGTFPTSVDIGTDWLASIRGRVGYAVDRTLIFATAGVGWTEATSDINLGGGATLSGSDSFVGWTVGGGVEYAFDDNWIGRVEYRYYDFGDKDLDGPAGLGSIDVSSSTLTVGVAYKF